MEHLDEENKPCPQQFSQWQHKFLLTSMKVSPAASIWIKKSCNFGEREGLQGAPAGEGSAAKERTEPEDRTDRKTKKKRRVFVSTPTAELQPSSCEQLREQAASALTTCFCYHCPASRERNLITQGLQSFESSTCIRFTPHQNQRDFVDIQSRSGCWSFVGRRGGGQVVSLMRNGCVFLGTIQHELLHALGFNHEQTRSDRDTHVRILLQNVISGQEHNFRKIETRNLGTPYDYNSIMHYGRYAFSRNREPTIVPIPDPNVAIGRATQMSNNDILRVNRLYDCRGAK